LARGAGALVLFALGGAALSCSLLIETSTKQCSQDSDCPKLGKAFEGSVCQKNLCVTPVIDDPLVCKTPDAGATQTVKLTFTVNFASKPAAPQPFQIWACNRLDVNCDSPVFGPVTANAGDMVGLDVPVGFQGYLQLKNPSTVNAMEFLARPLLEDTHGWDLTIASPMTVMLLGAATGTTIDPMLGGVVMIARDCNRTPLAGVQASIMVSQGDPNDAGPDTTVSFYFSNMFPSKSLMATTSEGAAGFVNVPIGSAILSGTTDSGRALSPTTAVSRAGWFSYVEVQP
jgi:hypothetical protein